MGIDKKYHYFFIHNIIGDFFHATLDYFGPYLYERFKYRVVTTFDKAVEYLDKTENYDRETDMPMLPALVLDPSGEMEPAEAIAGGKQLWRFPNLGEGLTTRLFEPVYQDSDAMVNVGFTRLRGTFTLNMLTNSYYEYCDLRLFMIQMLGGLERWIYPIWFSSFIILPEDFINFEYENEYTGNHHKLNWESAGAFDTLVKTTNRDEYVIPCHIKPIYKMTGITDNSSRGGGTDKLADWRLSCEMEYEIEIPSFLLIQTDYLVSGVKTKIGTATVYSENAMFNNLMTKLKPIEQTEFLNYIIEKHGEDYTIEQVRQDLTRDDKVKDMLTKEQRASFFGLLPEEKQKQNLEFDPNENIGNIEKEWDTGLDATSSGTIDLDPNKVFKECKKRDLIFRTRYMHLITEAEAESEEFNITVPEVVTSDRLVLVNKSGKLQYGDQYVLGDDGVTLTVKATNLEGLRKNDVLELYIYVYNE